MLTSWKVANHCQIMNATTQRKPLVWIPKRDTFGLIVGNSWRLFEELKKGKFEKFLKCPKKEEGKTMKEEESNSIELNDIGKMCVDTKYFACTILCWMVKLMCWNNK